MILRRLSTAFRKQDWFTVAVETLIVVLGVFIGLQVNNWNAARNDKQRGAVFAGQLRADLLVEAWNYEGLIDYLGVIRDNADRALAILEGKADASDEDLLIYAYRATQFQGGVRQRATFDELTSTGSMSLIRDKVLRDAAILVYTTPIIAPASGEGVHSPYRDAFRKSVPVEVQVALGETCGDKFFWLSATMRALEASSTMIAKPACHLNLLSRGQRPCVRTLSSFRCFGCRP